MTNTTQTTYAIKHSHGTTETGFETYEDAVAAVRSVYRSAEIGHSGDIEDGGESTLVWADAETAKDADESRACASIVKRHEEWGPFCPRDHSAGDGTPGYSCQPP